MVEENEMRAGVINTGKNNSFVDCEMSGPEAGMIDKGENTKVIRSKMKAKDNNAQTKGVFLRVGGDMQNDGRIITGKDSIVDIAVKGNYKSRKSEIIQDETSSPKRYWYEKPFGIIFIAVAATIIAGGILFWLGWV